MNQAFQNHKKVLSLFSGCGGMDLGFEGGFQVPKRSVLNPDWIASEQGAFVTLKRTAFQTVFANDIRPGAKAAWESFLGKRAQKEGFEPTYLTESIIDLVKRHKSGEKIFPTDIDIVTGGFPCQDFSLSGKRNGLRSHKSHSGDILAEHDDPSVENRGMLYYWMKEVIKITQPKMFVAENVKGLVSLSNVREIIEKDFSSIGVGYVVSPVRVLNAANFGVPQNRERVLFIGFNRAFISERVIELLTTEDPIVCPYPVKTHNLPKKSSEKLVPHVSVQEALHGLLEPHQSLDLSQQKYSKAKWYGRHCQGQTEVELKGISPTIRSEHHGNIEFRRLGLENGGKHKDEIKKGQLERRLSIRECARIQTFPDEYQFVIPGTQKGRKFVVSGSEAYKIIGNAVPPLLAFHLAMRLESIWEHIFFDSNNDSTKQPLAIAQRI